MVTKLTKSHRTTLHFFPAFSYSYTANSFAAFKLGKNLFCRFIRGLISRVLQGKGQRISILSVSSKANLRIGKCFPAPDKRRVSSGFEVDRQTDSAGNEASQEPLGVTWSWTLVGECEYVAQHHQCPECRRRSRLCS